MATRDSGNKEKAKVDGLTAWLEAKPYWERYLWRLHLEKDTLDTADLEKCYQYLLEDSGIIKTEPSRTPVVFPALNLDAVETSGPKRTLDKIEKLKNVNAIDDGCVIEFGKNLTIIYGDNGAGKSGIGRLLSNACLSRKPRKLLPNARKPAHPVPRPSADFHVTDASGLHVIKYNFGDVHGALRAFAVFDHECALIHLNSENKVEFVPSKIQVFDEVFRSISAIETKLQKEIEAKECDNPTEDVFEDASPLTDFLDSLSHETTDKKIEDVLKFTPADKAALAANKKEVAKKLKQDITAQKTLLQEECRDLETFKTTLAATNAILSTAKAGQINAALKETKVKKGIVDKLSAKSFEFAAFKHVGSPEWKALITAAQKLHEMETLSSDGVEPGYCLLCRQALTGKEKTLFGDYWKFLKSTAETELATARRLLASYLETLQRAETGWPSFSETEVAVKILKRDATDDLKKVKAGFDGLNDQRRDWISQIKKEQDVRYADPKIDFSPIGKLVAEKRKAEGKLVDPTAQINKLNGAIDYLEQKQQASRLIGKIKKYVAWLRWHDKVGAINLPAVRGATTRKKTEFMGKIVMSQYAEIFNKETERLDCRFGLKVESHGRDANTIKELKLEFAPGYNPSDILSEGEQTVSALADFLTEAKLDKNNSGIVFDDPVTSLDHERRSTIAKRLVEEAEDRQVVVLTHDIVFLLDLQHYADSESVGCISVSMRKDGNSIGLIKPELPWIALDVKKKVGYLRNKLSNLKKAETGDPDEYRDQVKLWYMLLRESWERAVEERLFKGVVQRFNKGVQTQRLERIEVTDALVKEVTDGMTESSKWLHDMAAGVNPAVPNSAKLEGDLKLIDEFITKCAP
jgi:energy-coupling factor transporter ATP-binding protein EcfA2